MPDKKKTNAVKLTTVEKNKALMAKYKKERNNKTNTKSSKTNRTTVKKKKRLLDKWGNPTKYNKATNKNLAFVKKTGNDVLAGKDKVSQAFSLVAGGGVSGALAKVAAAKKLHNTAKVVKTAAKVKKANSLS